MLRFCHRPGRQRPILDRSPILVAWAPDPTPTAAPSADPRIARQFDARYDGWTEDEGFPELVDVSGAILDLLRDTALRRPSVLELGCGTAALGVALLEMGAARLTGVDLSPASIDLARQRADAAGFAEAATFEVGNAVATDGGSARLGRSWIGSSAATGTSTPSSSVRSRSPGSGSRSACPSRVAGAGS